MVVQLSTNVEPVRWDALFTDKGVELRRHIWHRRGQRGACLRFPVLVAWARARGADAVGGAAGEALSVVSIVSFQIERATGEVLVF
jgi:hypothetical protein